MIDISRRGALIFAALAAAGVFPCQSAISGGAAPDLTNASARFGLDLLLQLSTQSLSNLEGRASNLAISPASIMAAFGLVDVGASPPLHEALNELFHLDGPAGLDDLRASLAPLISNRPRSGSLSAIEAVCVDPQVRLKQTALDALRALHAKLERRRLDNPEAVQAINALVRKETRGRIPSIIDAPLARSGLVLLNAIYFKDSWRQEFDARLTRPADFHRAIGGTSRVSMMHGGVQLLPAAQDGAFAAVRLPYETEGYSLTLVLNRKNAALPADFAGVGRWLTGAGLTDYYVTLALPRFAFEAGSDVLPALDALGLASARSAPDALARFSDAPLQIAAVAHKVAIAVDEGGTTAAAATAVAAPTTSAPPPVGIPSLDFIADKPFMFALRDERRGLVLLLGYVGDPVEAS